MRITINKQSLSESLQVIMGAVAQKNTLPILSNILLEVTETHINITATDLDIGITHRQEAAITEQGAVTVPAKRFFDIIKELPNEELQINTKKNNTMIITTKNTTIKILTTPTEEFPNIPTAQHTQSLIIEQRVLKKMLTCTAFAMSKEETRYVLNAACITIQENHLEIIATDGRRLAIAKEKHKTKTQKPTSIIVPSKTIHELLKTLSDTGVVEMRVAANQVVFAIQNTTIISRLIEGEYPNYQQAIPQKSNSTLKIDRNNLIPAIKRASLLTTPESQAITLHLASNKLTISKTSPDIGETREDLEVVYKGEDIQIGFNPAYILDVLKNIDEDFVEIEFTGPEKPGVVRVRDEYIYIVLPMQII